MLLRDTLFLVDPSPSSRGALRKIFENSFNILEASNTIQAELLFRHNHAYIAAILVDIKLMGFEEISILRKSVGEKNLSLIPLIAIVDSDDVTLGSGGTVRFSLKPHKVFLFREGSGERIRCALGE